MAKLFRCMGCISTCHAKEIKRVKAWKRLISHYIKHPTVLRCNSVRYLCWGNMSLKRKNFLEHQQNKRKVFQTQYKELCPREPPTLTQNPRGHLP